MSRQWFNIWCNWCKRHRAREINATYKYTHTHTHTHTHTAWIWASTYTILFIPSYATKFTNFCERMQTETGELWEHKTVKTYFYIYLELLLLVLFTIFLGKQTNNQTHARTHVHTLAKSILYHSKKCVAHFSHKWSTNYKVKHNKIAATAVQNYQNTLKLKR